MTEPFDHEAYERRVKWLLDVDEMPKLSKKARRRINLVVAALEQANYEAIQIPFITGALGTQGADGLHGAYIIAPCYGVDACCSAIYTRSSFPDNPKEEEDGEKVD